jgi:hypothetical protein
MAGAVSRSLQTAMSSEGREPGAVQYSCIQTITYYLLESLLRFSPPGWPFVDRRQC